MKSYVILPIFLLITLISCNKDDSTDPDRDVFFGTWEIVEAEGEFAELNVGTEYTFTENGDVTITKGFSSMGTFIRTDSEITITIASIPINYTYTISGNRMNWINTSDSDQVFRFEKR